MRLSRTFRISGILSALGIVLLVAVHGKSDGTVLKAVAILLILFAAPTFAVSALRHLIRGLLWRVGSRLLVSYLLIGVVPAPFVAGFLFAGTLVFCGQLGGRRAEAALRSRARSLAAAARSLAGTSRLSMTPDGRRALFEQIRVERKDDLPGLEYVYSSPGGEPEASGSLPPGQLAPLPAGDDSVLLLARWKGNVYLASAAAAGNGRLILALPLDAKVAEKLGQETGIRIGFSTTVTTPRAARRKAQEQSGLIIETKDEDVRFRAISGSRAASAAPARLIDREWVHWFLPVDRPIDDWETGKPVEGKLVLSIHSSIGRELRELYGSARIGTGSGTETGTIVLTIMKGLGLIAVCVWVLASLLAALLVLRIARAARRLSRGFAEIDRGNFSYRAALRGQDQLAGLVESFNQMASHLESSISEKASHEALEKELETARSLQRRLLPPPDFRFPGLDIAVDFRPASAIGGDFYHFQAEGSDRLTVVVADVSGHGLSTGIVMAAAKASLSAFAATGADSIAVLTNLDEEIHRTTDPRTFVTLAHLTFRFDTQEVEFTNAGHIYPYRVEPLGSVSMLSNPARPLGLGLPAAFRTVRAPLVPGDLWVLLSDGIVEALSEEEELFGFVRLETLLARGAGGSAAEMRDRILAAWREFTGTDTPADDRTLLVLKVLPRQPQTSDGEAVALPSR